MRKFVIILVLINLVFTILAQTSVKHPVLLVPVNKPCTIKINGNLEDIQTEFLCDNNSKIEVIKGQIMLLSVNGNERILQTGNIITIAKEDRSKNNIPLDKVSKYLDKPSYYLPSLYSSNRSEMIVFPLNSKVIDINNIKFLFSEESVGKEAVFKIYLKANDSLVWHTDNPLDKKSWLNLPVEYGKSYYWKMYCGSNSIKGEIELLDKEQVTLSLNPYKNKKDYVQAYFYLLENECFFDALAVLQKACKAYPDSELFKKLLETVTSGKIN